MEGLHGGVLVHARHHGAGLLIDAVSEHALRLFGRLREAAHRAVGDELVIQHPRVQRGRCLDPGERLTLVRKGDGLGRVPHDAERLREPLRRIDGEDQHPSARARGSERERGSGRGLAHAACAAADDDALLAEEIADPGDGGGHAPPASGCARSSSSVNAATSPR